MNIMMVMAMVMMKKTLLLLMILLVKYGWCHDCSPDMYRTPAPVTPAPPPPQNPVYAQSNVSSAHHPSPAMNSSHGGGGDMDRWEVIKI